MPAKSLKGIGFRSSPNDIPVKAKRGLSVAGNRLAMLHLKVEVVWESELMAAVNQFRSERQSQWSVIEMLNGIFCWLPQSGTRLVAFSMAFAAGAFVEAQSLDTCEGTSCCTDDFAFDACDSRACDSSSCDSFGCKEFSFCSWLDGDQSPRRKKLSDNGIRFTNNLTNFYFGNTRGGIDREFRFGGHGDYLANLDINKLGGPQGQFLQIRAEHRYGESLGGATGALLPPTIATDLPVPGDENVYITNFLFTQALSDSFMLYAGKMDTLDGDMNAFAHGRGIRQFSNSAFVVNPIGLRTVAYSTLGTGFVFLKDGAPIYNFLVLNARETTRSDGLSELFADGAVISQELRLPTNFFGKSGHQLFGAIWSSREFAALDQSPIVILPSVPIARQSGSWALTYNFDQYLFQDPCDSKKGWGVFGRAGLADPETNPIEYFLSLGVGGNSRLRGRDNDTFGLGWYYSGTSNAISPFLSTALGDLQDGQGGEMFYNIAVNKRMFLTADGQVILPARSTVETSLVFGLRANLIF